MVIIMEERDDIPVLDKQMPPATNDPVQTKAPDKQMPPVAAIGDKFINFILSGFSTVPGRINIGIKDHPMIINSVPWETGSMSKTFEETVRSNIILMGSGCWNSIPPQHRPIKNCLNIVVSRNAVTLESEKYDTIPGCVDSIRYGEHIFDGVYFVDSVDAAIKFYRKHTIPRPGHPAKLQDKELFAIGGHRLFAGLIDRHKKHIKHIYFKLVRTPGLPSNIDLDVSGLKLRVINSSPNIKERADLFNRVLRVPEEIEFQNLVYFCDN